MNLLVFGAEGQLGQLLAEECERAGIAAAFLGRQEGDIADPYAVFSALETYQPRIVVNAAAYTNVDRAETHPEQAYRSNSWGPAILARIVGQGHVPLIHLSTDYVFDGRKDAPYDESDLVAPINTYGRTKEAGECAVRDAASAHIILRTSWLFSKRGNNFLRTILRLAADRQEISVVSDTLGNPTGADALAAAILVICRAIHDGLQPWGTYHFAGTGQATWHAFAECILKRRSLYTSHGAKLTAIAGKDYPTAARRPVNSRLDTAKFIRTFGMVPARWQASVEKAVDALLAKDGPSR